MCLLQHGSVSGSRAWEPHHVPGLSAVLFILETKGQQKKEKVCCHKLNFNVVERHFSLFALENYSGQCNIGKLLLGTKGTSTASISWDSRIFFLFHKVINMKNLILLSIKY